MSFFPPEYSDLTLEQQRKFAAALGNPDYSGDFPKVLSDLLSRADVGPPLWQDTPATDMLPANLPPIEYRGESMANIPQRPFIDKPPAPPAEPPLPENFIRNERTGRVINLDQFQTNKAGPALDYTMPIEFGGLGKGYRLKGDPTRAVMADGRIIDLGRDTGAERQRAKEDLLLAKGRAELEQTGLENQKKRQDLKDDATANAQGTLSTKQLAQLGIRLKPGERYNATTGTVELIPGSDPHRKQVADITEKSGGMAALGRVVGRMQELVKDVNEAPGKDAAVGMWDAWAPVFMSLTPQDKTNARSKIKNLQEYLQTRGLADLRSSGVAPGSITEKEWGKFAAMIANIDPSLSEGEFTKELAKLQQMAASYSAEAEAKKEAYRKEYGPAWDKYAVKAPETPPAAPAAGVTAGAPGSPEHKAAWMAKARELNKNMSGAELEAKYLQKFKGK